MAAMDEVGAGGAMALAHKIKRDAFTLLRTRLRCMALVIKIYEMVSSRGRIGTQAPGEARKYKKQICIRQLWRQWQSCV